MSGQIFQPNLTDYDFGIQARWQTDPRACYRPPSDFQVPILCIAYPNFYDYPKNSTNPSTNSSRPADNHMGEDFELYTECCPTSQKIYYPANYTRDNINQYISNRQCSSSVCFTTNETVARSWEGCVKEKAEAAVEERKDGVLRTKGRGRCEFVNYENLRKGVRESDGGESLKGRLGFVALAVVWVVGLGFVGSF